MNDKFDELAKGMAQFRDPARGAEEIQPEIFMDPVMNVHLHWIPVTLALLLCFGDNHSTAFARDTVFTYQGRVMANGTNFTGAGQFKFALVTSTNTSLQATATANLNGQFVVGYTVTAGGNGYLSAPAVSVIGGGGSGATAHSTISGGVVTSVVADSAGSGYTNPPTVIIAPPPPSIAYATWWSNDGTSVGGSEPSASVIVGVSNGLFTVAIGDTTVSNMTAIGVSLFAAQPHLQLRIWFNDGVSGFAALSPPQDLSPAPYAVVAASASSLAGALSAAQLTSIGNTNAGASGNFFVGLSGNSTMSGSSNTAYGVTALLNNTSGAYNTGDGVNALYYNTTGSYNTANGLDALFNNASGSFNTADGVYALFNNTSGSGNTADGYGALSGNTSGYNNIAIGLQAGANITTGSYNIDIGNPGASTDTNIIRIGSGQSQAFIAGVLNGNGSGLTSLKAAALTSIGNGNFFIGQSGNPTTSGFGNTANGANALNFNTTGSYNTANGYQALYSNTSGYQNTANGDGALRFNTSGALNTADGDGALYLNTSGYGNTACGGAALTFNTNGSFNTACGAGALYVNTSGSYNTACGNSALSSNTIASWNIAVGNLAGFNITTGSSNIDIGNPGLATDTNIIRIGTGQSQTFIAGVLNGIGYGLTSLRAAQLTSVGNSSGGFGNFYVGPSGNSATAGSYDTANGYQALNNELIGSYNTANGALALFSNAYGSDNTANGTSALSGNTSGSYNTAIGSGALANNASGSYNIAIGYQAGFYTTGSSNIDIGNPGVSTDANIIRIGSGQSATFLAGDVYATSFNPTSDRNAKADFTQVDAQTVLAKVAALPISEWNFKADPAGLRHIGPMAQDFHAAFGLNGSDDKHISMTDEAGVALAAIQGLNQKLDVENAELKRQNQCLEKRLEALEQVLLKKSRN